MTSGPLGGMLNMEGYAMKKILITPYEDRSRFCLHSDYMNAVLSEGGLSYVLPQTTDEKLLRAYLEGADGLILSGGGDVEPALYGEERSPLCGEAEPVRDEMEMKLCRMAVEMDIPLLCICRGLQVMNVALGGTLWQHLPMASMHDRCDTPKDAVHEVRVEKGSLLHEILGEEVTSVNSRHHQGIKTLAPGLVPAAFSEDGLAEAFEMPGKRFFLAVQWHPESMYDHHYENAQKIFAAFMAAVKEKT